jgi:type II secretory pathway pseudopilin PulG
MHAGKHRARVALRGDESGISGIMEMVIVLVLLGILMAIIIPTFIGPRNTGNDNTTQAYLNTAVQSAQGVYNDSQDYGAIANNTATTGACSTTSQAYSAMAAGANNLTFTCSGPLTSFSSATKILWSAGELPDGNAGGWIGFAAASASGKCWQVYIPADGSAEYSSGNTNVGSSCTAPTPTTGLSGNEWP